VLRGQPFERVDIRAIGLTRHPDNLGAAEAQNAKQVVVAGVVDERRIARLYQQADKQIERLARRGRQQDLRSLYVDPDIPKQHA
jgi:hypothetical protein